MTGLCILKFLGGGSSGQGFSARMIGSGAEMGVGVEYFMHLILSHLPNNYWMYISIPLHEISGGKS